MKRIFSIAFLLLAAYLPSGCDVDNNNHGYGFEYDFETSLGIRYRNSTDREGLNADDIDNTYINLTNCAGQYIDPAGLTIVTITGLEHLGQFIPDSDLIFMLPLPRDTSLIVLNHEFIHYYLKYTAGYPDATHESPLFSNCEL